MSIEVKNLFKYYGDQAAVRDVSFSIAKGEIVGFLGPNGAGKSTTMKILTGFISASSGEVNVCGLPVDVDSLNTRQKIGYLPEHNPLYLDMYVKEYLEFVGKTYKVKDLKNALSKGYRQRVGLAAAIIHDPEVLILDEPTSGLDPNQLVEIRELIKKIGKSKTVMLSTHIMQEVEAICDRVVIINKGQIVADDTASHLQIDLSHQTVYAEFDGEITKSTLSKIKHVRKVEKVTDGWLLETTDDVDLRKILAKYAQENNLLILTMKTEEKSLEEVFKELTK
jgi:ABC-2 type transport system ATP-binding protein